MDKPGMDKVGEGVSGQVLAVLLAGGRAERMGGGDKGLKLLAGRPILDHVLDRLKGQTAGVILNANGDPARFAAYGLPVVADGVSEENDGKSGSAAGPLLGPLAGVLAGLEWAAANRPEITDIVTVPTDGPFVPRDLVQWLWTGRRVIGGDLAVAASGGRPNPVIGLWPVRLAGDLRRALGEEGIRKVDVWTARYTLATVHFNDDPVDPFFNANRPDDLVEAERLYGLLKD